MFEKNGGSFSCLVAVSCFLVSCFESEARTCYPSPRAGFRLGMRAPEHTRVGPRKARAPRGAGAQPPQDLRAHTLPSFDKSAPREALLGGPAGSSGGWSATTARLSRAHLAVLRRSAPTKALSGGPAGPSGDLKPREPRRARLRRKAHPRPQDPLKAY